MVEAASDWVICVVMYSDESDLVLEIRNPQAHLPRSQLPSHGVCVPVPLPLSRSQLPSHGVRGSESGSALGETPGANYCSHATGIFIMLGLHAPHLLRRRSRGTADTPGMV